MSFFLARLFNQQPIEPVQKAQPFLVSTGRDIVAPDNTPQGDYTLSPLDQRRAEMDALWTAYEKSPWIRKCVKAIARGISKKIEIVPRDPQAEVNGDAIARIQTFLNNLYADPNTPETFEAFIAKALISIVVYGHVACELRTTSGKAELVQGITKALGAKGPELEKAFEQLGFGPMLLPNYEQEVQDAIGAIPEDGLPAYLRVLPTKTIEVVQDAKGNIKQYNQWQNNGKKVIFRPDEIFHLVHPDSFDFAYGESQIANLAILATLDRLIDDRQKNVLSGDAAIDTLFTIQDGTPETIKALAQELVTKYRGSGAQQRFLVAPEGVKVDDLSKSKDGDFLKLKEWIRDEICLTMGVPLSVLGVTDGVAGKGSGADQHMRNYVENVLRPMANHFEAAFNRHIMARFQQCGIDYILKIVLEDADDMTDVVNRINTQVRGGLMTNNEGRKVLNLPSMDGGDVLWVDAKQPTRLADIAEGPIAMNPGSLNPGATGILPNGLGKDQQKAVEKAQQALRSLRKTF